MSIQSVVKVQRLAKGKYKVNGWEVWDVPGKTGWRAVSPDGQKSEWFKTFTKAKQYVSTHSVS